VGATTLRVRPTPERPLSPSVIKTVSQSPEAIAAAVAIPSMSAASSFPDAFKGMIPTVANERSIPREPELLFNATSPIVSRARAAGLVIHQPLRPQTEMIRGILCPHALDLQLSGKDQQHGLPSLGVAVTIGKFVGGRALAISRRKRRRRWRGPDIDLEQLEGIDEVSVLCFRKPGAGWRLLGRFLEQDALALFRIKDKRDIGNNYEPAAAEVISDWQALLGDLPPCTGDDLSAYLSGAHYNVDENTEVAR
jgi:hypothetical protein